MKGEKRGIYRTKEAIKRKSRGEEIDKTREKKKKRKEMEERQVRRERTE